MTDLDPLVAVIREAFSKHPERALELTRDYVDGLRSLLGEAAELSAKEYARVYGYKERTIWKACRDGRLPARKHDGVWRISCSAKLASFDNTTRPRRMRVVRSAQLDRYRWSVELACGHEKTVTSHSDPCDARCPTCTGREGPR